MRILIILILIVINNITFCQYLSPPIYKVNLIDQNGDTINRIDNDSLYHGKWIIFAESKNGINVDTSYIIGCFKHGKPIGEWKFISQKEYGFGRYITADEQYINSRGKSKYRKNGTGSAIGIWKFYDKRDSLIRLEKFVVGNFLFIEWERAYIKFPNDKEFRLIESYYNNWFTNSGKSVEVDSLGTMVIEKENLFNTKTYKYFPGGNLKEKKSYSRISKKVRIKRYSENGTLVEKKSEKKKLISFGFSF